MMEWVIIGMSFTYDDTFSQISNSLKSVCWDLNSKAKKCFDSSFKEMHLYLGLFRCVTPPGKDAFDLRKCIIGYMPCHVCSESPFLFLICIIAQKNPVALMPKSSWFIPPENKNTLTPKHCALITPMVMARFPAVQSIQILVSRKCCETSLVICPLELWGRGLLRGREFPPQPISWNFLPSSWSQCVIASLSIL